MSYERTLFRRDVRELPTHPIPPKTFPFPDRMYTFSHPLPLDSDGTLNGRREFLSRQVTAANEAREHLVQRMLTNPELPSRDWRKIYISFVAWRYNEALEQNGTQPTEKHDERLIVPNMKLIISSVTDDHPNHDIFGDVRWLQARAQWNDSERKWVGGEETLSSILYQNAGDWAKKRFVQEAPEDDLLQNIVTLPDGRQIHGNMLMRKTAFKTQGESRGEDQIRYYSDHDNNILSVSGTKESRETIFTAAMNELATMKPKEGTIEDWARIAYYLYQAPQHPRGIDAVVRNFMAVVGSYLFENPPVIPQDIDIRALILDQASFIAYVKEQQSQDIFSRHTIT